MIDGKEKREDDKIADSDDMDCYKGNVEDHRIKTNTPLPKQPEPFTIKGA